jgi:hypothetical protein
MVLLYVVRATWEDTVHYAFIVFPNENEAAVTHGRNLEPEQKGGIADLSDYVLSACHELLTVNVL